MSDNKVILTGNLGERGVEVIQLESDRKMAVLSLATNYKYDDKETGEEVKKTTWHKAVAFNPILIEKLRVYGKGERLEITGSLDYQEHIVNKDGKEFTLKEASIIVRSFEHKPLVKKS